MTGDSTRAGSAATAARLLHLTDFHFDSNRQPAQSARIDALVEAAIADLDGRVDAVIVTGDVAMSGASVEYALFRSHVVDKINAAFEQPPRWFVVPGNHDKHWCRNGPHGPAPNMISSTKDRASVDVDKLDAFNGAKPRSECSDRLSEFIDAGLGEGRAWINDDGVYRASLPTACGFKIGLALVNSTWFCAASGSKNDSGKLICGTALLGHALKEMESERYDQILVVGHHPAADLAPSERKDFECLMARTKAIHICGHHHRGDGVPHVHREGFHIEILARAADFAGSRESPPWTTPGGYSIIEFPLGKTVFRLRPRIVSGTPGVSRPDSDAFSSETWGRDDWIEYPLPSTTEFIDWRRMRTGWAPFRSTPTPASEARLRCWREGDEPGLDIGVRSAFVDGGIADRAFRSLHSDPLCGFSGVPTALIETPGCEGATTAVFAVMARCLSEGWSVYKFDPDANEFVSPDVDAALRRESGRRILFVVEDVTRYPAAVGRFLADLRARGVADRVGVLLGADALERSASDERRGENLPNPRLAWDFGERPEMTARLKEMSDPERSGLRSALVDDTVPGQPSWSWAGALLRSTDERSRPSRESRGARMVARVERHLGGIPSAMDTLILVATPHAKGRACLTPDVLARAVGKDASDLERELDRLGPEIRRVSVGDRRIVLSRHRAVAELWLRMLKPAVDPSKRLLRAVSTVLTETGTAAFWTEWMSFASEVDALDLVSGNVDWKKTPPRFARGFAEVARGENGGIEALELALGEGPEENDEKRRRGEWALLADLLGERAEARAGDRPERELSAVAALAALRGVPGIPAVIEERDRLRAIRALREFVENSAPVFPTDTREKLDASTRFSPRMNGLAGTLRDVARQLDEYRGVEWAARLGRPADFRFPDTLSPE